MILGGDPNETVNISLTQIGGSSSDLIGASVTITDDDTGDTLFSATWNGSTITTEIEVNTNYTVSVETIVGYSHPSPQSYHAYFQNKRNISFQYASQGAYVEAIDGSLYTASTWQSSGKEVNSIVLITSQISVRIYPTILDYTIIKPMGKANSSTDPNPATYVTTVTTANEAKVDYDGYTNTQKWLKYNAATGTYTNDYAAPYATSTIFPNGVTRGYIPAAGQIYIIRKNYSIVNPCFLAIGISEPANVHYQSSTYGGINAQNYYCVWTPYSQDVEQMLQFPLSYTDNWNARKVMICANY